MKVVRDAAGHIYMLEVEKDDTLEEMAAMAAMTMADLGEKISKIIAESWTKKEESK